MDIDRLNKQLTLVANIGILDRLTHHCHILETGIDSYRLKNSITNNKETKGKKKPKPEP